MSDPFDLARFVAAQDEVLERVHDELSLGRKRSHWMWFVFPQIAGLGSSALSKRYAVGSVEEGLAYLAHAALGPRLIACTALVNRLTGRSAHDIFGSPDDLKFHSSMTLFASIQQRERVFDDAIGLFFEGRRDVATLRLLTPR